VYGTVVQDPYEYGKRSIEILDSLSKGDTSVIPENKFVDIPARQIRKDNVDAFWSDLNSKLGKYWESLFWRFKKSRSAFPEWSLFRGLTCRCILPKFWPSLERMERGKVP
jgi:hypothetical protein